MALLVVVGAAALALLSALLDGRPRARRALGVALLMAYACACARITVTGRRAGAEAHANLLLLWSYRASLARDGCWLRVERADLLQQIVLNYLLFVPLGCLLPLAWPDRFSGRGAARGLAAVALVAAACSLCIELSQLVLRVGLFELDDVLDNALGAALGYALFRLAELAARRVLRWLEWYKGYYG